MNKVTLRTFLHPRFWYAWPVLTIMLIMSWMPDRVRQVLGNALGTIVSWLPTSNRRFAKRNLELCFPEMSPGERHRLLKQHFCLSGYAMLSLSVTWLAPLGRLKRLTVIRDQHHISDVYARGKNVILLAPHFIGLDMGGVRLSAEQKYVSMYRKSRDPLLEYLFQRRERFGGIVLERMSSLKPIIRYIREGRPFYYLPDQDMGERSSVFANFFGIPAATVTALSRIAQTTNAEVVPCITRVRPDGRGFEVCLHAALKNFPTDDPAADAQQMNNLIEQWVREMPEQYMWTYRRFKTRPNNEPSLYV